MNQAIENAMVATLAAYDLLIADPEGERGKWKEYGTWTTCRLCAVFGLTSHPEENPESVNCPLAASNAVRHCATACIHGDMCASRLEMLDVRNIDNTRFIVAAATARRAVLAAKFKKYRNRVTT